MAEPRVYKLYIQPGMKVLLPVILIAFAGFGAAIALSPSLFPGPKAPPPLVGGILLVIFGLYLGWVLCLPYRITLSEDGAIEFISVLRRRTVRAEEIKSIQPAPSGLLHGQDGPPQNQNSGPVRRLSRLPDPARGDAPGGGTAGLIEMKIIPWRCHVCGGEFETPGGGRCGKCGKVTCKACLKTSMVQSDQGKKQIILVCQKCSSEGISARR